MTKKLKQDRCTVYERNGQLVLSLNNEILLHENAPARLTSAQLEELDYSNLYRAYSARGRKSKVDPRVLFKVMVYGYQQGIYTSRKLEEACRYRIDFMWLLEEYPAPDHATLARFRMERCAEVSRRIVGSICVCAVLFRWRALSLCSRQILLFVVSSPVERKMSEQNCSSSQWRLT